MAGDMGTRRRSLVLLGVKGGAAGVAVGAATLMIMLAAYNCHGDAWECLGVALMAFAGALLLAPVVSWIVLRLLGIEWAFAVAMCGTLTTLLLAVLVPLPGSSPTVALPMVVALAAAGYGTCAVALSKVTRTWMKGIHITGLVLFVAALAPFVVLLVWS